MLKTDFTPSLLPKLYQALKAQGYAFVTFEEYLANKDSKKFVVLRHDVSCNGSCFSPT